MVDVLERIAFREDFARQASVTVISIGGDLAELIGVDPTVVSPAAVWLNNPIFT